MEFQPGDVVKLKSGGEKMTIESISEGLCDCVWFEDKKVVRNSFDPVVLKKFEPGRVAIRAF
jgi:uncharacterized protein YodC (DUF2158 family)